MRRGTLLLLLFIILLAVGASYVDFWPSKGPNGKPLYGIPQYFSIQEGLDLQGGVQVLLVPSPGQPTPTQEEMNNARNQIEKRVNGGLGVNEPDIRVQNGSQGPSISVELPGLNSGNQQEAIQTLLKTGNLEFWDTGPSSNGCLADNTSFDPTQYKQYNGSAQALFTGKDLDPNSLQVGTDPTSGAYLIEFSMKGSALGRFSSFTANHINDCLTVTLDRKVITSAAIQSQIAGNGQITGNFTEQQASSIVELLKYGALPIPLSIASEQIIGPTLGQDSIQRSIIAGAIGLSIVVIFMLLYYRLPGFLADIALVLYSIMTFAVFKTIHVTLTLPGIAGFILSIGMAVDANVLIFERVKEELRAGRLLASAIDIGWKRAWPSIRDSNCSTMITCAVLYFFGSNFGATIIVGFATTLFLGVVISMFTAVVVTRTFLNLLVPTGAISHPALFGLPADAIPSPSRVRRGSAVEGGSRV
jgi:preprotein translocase subunit SecD